MGLNQAIGIGLHTRKTVFKLRTSHIKYCYSPRANDTMKAVLFYGSFVIPGSGLEIQSKCFGFGAGLFSIPVCPQLPAVNKHRQSGGVLYLEGSNAPVLNEVVCMSSNKHTAIRRLVISD